MNIIFPGSFDVFHEWHLTIVKKSQDRFGQQIRIIVTNDNPFKQKNYWNIDMRREIAEELVWDMWFVWIASTRRDLLRELSEADKIIRWLWSRDVKINAKDFAALMHRIYLLPYLKKLVFINSESTVSSSYIGKLITDGNIEKAMQYTSERWVNYLKQKYGITW